MIYLIFGLLLFFLIFSIIKDKDFLSPSVLFNFMWLLTLSLYQLKISYWQQDFSDRTLWIFFLCIISYNLCGLFFSLFKFRKIRLFSQKKRKKSLDKKIASINIIILFLFIIEVVYSQGFPLLWKITGSSKTYLNFGIPSLHGALSGLVICLGSYYLFKKSKLKWLYLTFGILILSRQVIISIIIEAIILNIKTVYNKLKKINVKKYAVLLLIVIIFFGVVGNFRSGKDTMNNLFYPKEQYRNMPTSIMWGYSYLTFSLSNFNNLVSMTDGAENNGTTVLNVLLPSVVTKQFKLEEKFNKNYLVNTNFTVSTYLADIYIDFGIIGIIILNSLIACIGVYYYKQSKYKSSDKNNLLYAVFIHNIVFLFFNNMFIYLPVIIQIIYINLLFDEEEGYNENQNT